MLADADPEDREYELRLKMTIAILSAMDSQGVSALELARRTNKHPTQVYQYFTANCDMLYSTIVKLEQALGVKLIEIVL